MGFLFERFLSSPPIVFLTHLIVLPFPLTVFQFTMTVQLLYIEKQKSKFYNNAQTDRDNKH